ncbi:3-hydroxyacyl-CoA dehydrogenase PaaH [Marinobacterium arenosum]|uniref:3-hydroxyacyl-CoA dehydrogenase PaaH n=1 Tax=Marinobacterium arenosum TaxID=2862496 RepID=UPI001C96C17E|nr:3-hydroxyacyl-CoA dehydrogenase PaaH [Marinobacterium arenosum]MBY4677153.1 3-hydroxyacyl-CoA dehydrogenase PaaC [Marinobacterium arenosum]
MSHLTTESIIGVIGAGTMGAGIAQVAAKAGHPVLLFDAMEGAAQKGLDGVANGLARLVAKGKMSQDQVDALVGRIQVVDSLNDLAPAALVVEAIVERLDIKQQVFGDLEKICAENTIIASNTSSISITAIGAKLARPQNLVGMHFFNPAPIMKLVEVISGLDTDPAVAEAIYQLSERWGKQPVHAKSTPGFIVNRVARPFYAEGLRVAEEGGADIATIDALLKQCGGFRMGPFELMDLIGHDVNYAVTSSVFEAYYYDQRFLPALIQLELVNAGHLGRKSGKGFYDYSEGAEKPQPQTAAPAPAPKTMTVEGSLGVAEPLVALCEQAGIKVFREDDGNGCIRVGEATLLLTNGQFATARAAASSNRNLIHFDLALDYQNADRIALSPADHASAEAVNTAVGLFQAIGKQVSLIDDIPGMAVMRTVAMLANEGFDAVNQQVCSEEAVDIAMQGGVNYPRGPLAWAQQIGLGNVLQVLNNLAGVYGDDRYRASPLLRRKVAGGI